MTQTERNILVGKIVAPQGIRGEVRVQTFTEKPTDFQNLSVFGDSVPMGAFHFVRAMPNTNVIIARIDGVADRNAAETMRNVELYIDRDALPPAGPDEYYQADLVGMRVMRDGFEIGRVACFQNFGAGDIVELDNGEMVAFGGAVVDFNAKTIKVR